MKKIMLALEIDVTLKTLLDECKKVDGRSRTWHLRKALENYFISKKIFNNKKGRGDETYKQKN